MSPRSTQPAKSGSGLGLLFPLFGLLLLPTPTLGGADNVAVSGSVAETKLDVPRGFFFAPFNLTISCPTPGATIVYTTNGNDPNLSSGVQISSLNSTAAPRAIIPIATTTTLRAAAFKSGFGSSAADTRTYIFPASVASQQRPPGASATWIEDPPVDGRAYPADYTVDASVVTTTLPGYSFTNALLSLPTVSLVTPMDGFFGPINGIYTHPLKEGTNWERNVSVELIYPDGRAGFHVRAGVQLHGDVSQLPHATPKHPLRLFFRKRYGPGKLDYPLFPGPVHKFDQLILRACSTDAWPMANTVDFLWRNFDATYQRDQWMRDTQLALGHLSARGIYVQPPNFSSTNGLSVWLLAPDQMKALRTQLNQTGEENILSRPRITTADGIESSLFVGGAIPIAGLNQQVGLAFRSWARVQPDSTDLIACFTHSEVATNNPAELGESSPRNPITIQTNLDVAFRLQVPDGSGFFFVNQSLGDLGRKPVGIIIDPPRPMQ